MEVGVGRGSTVNAQVQRKIKRGNAQLTYSGLVWKLKKRKNDLCKSVLRADDVILGSKDGVGSSSMKPNCDLCSRPYCPDLMYIRCEQCRHWSHGDALGLEEARLGEVVYYRCCRCRRQALPRCPHSDDYHPKRSEAEPISRENAADILASAEAVGTAGDNSSYARRVENPVEETVDAYSPLDMESFAPESNEEINFVDGSSHSTHLFDKVETKQVMKDVRPHDACFSWYTPGSNSCRPLDSVDGFPPPAPTVETNLDKNQTVILTELFRVIAAETGSLYERLRQGDLLSNDEIMGTLDMLQQIALHRMKDIACCQVDGIIYPEATAQPMHNANTTNTTLPSDHQSSSSRTPAPDAVATPS